MFTRWAREIKGSLLCHKAGGDPQSNSALVPWEDDGLKEAQQHLRDSLFLGVRKHISDYAWYLYSTPGISYSQLMIAAWKAESKNEENQDWVRVKAAVTIEPVEVMA